MSWSREFDEPIETPDGTQLTTLREAVAYLAKTAPSRTAVMKALHRHEVRQFNPDRKRRTLAQAEGERDQRLLQ